MATMNNKRGRMKEDKNTTVNHVGTTVHSLTSLEFLFSRVLTSFFGEKTFYENRTAESDYNSLQETISKVDDRDIEYVLKIAKLGRDFNMIQYPLAVLTACFNDDRFKGESFIDSETGNNKLQTYSDSIIRRGRDILDVMAIQLNAHEDRPLPMQMRKSLKRKLESFNEYQLSKALGKNKEVSLADCIKLLRPNPQNANVSSTFYKRIIEDDVTFGNGEKQIQSELARGDGYSEEDMIESLKTSSLLSILKNLVALYRRNLFSVSDSALSILSERFGNAEEIKRSKILPFRFYSAYKEISNCFDYSQERVQLLDIISNALDLSVCNLPDIEGYSAIVIDHSGSMDRRISARSSVTAKDIACLLGAIMAKKGVADVYVFATDVKQVTVSRRSTIIDSMNIIRDTLVGGATYLHKVFDLIDLNHIRYDNIVILSDGDCYRQTSDGFEFDCYFSFSPSPDFMLNNLFNKGLVKKVYVNNLLGNNFCIVNTDDYRKNLIAGFSERIVDLINFYSVLCHDGNDIRNVIDSMISGC